MDRIDDSEPMHPSRPPRQRGKARRLPDIDPTRCTGCGRCVAACDLHLLSLESVRWVKVSVLHAPERCTGCNACAAICPFDAITLRAPKPDNGANNSEE
jgi:ferredoxin